MKELIRHTIFESDTKGILNVKYIDNEKSLIIDTINTFTIKNMYELDLIYNKMKFMLNQKNKLETYVNINLGSGQYEFKIYDHSFIVKYKGKPNNSGKFWSTIWYICAADDNSEFGKIISEYISKKEFSTKSRLVEFLNSNQFKEFAYQLIYGI